MSEAELRRRLLEAEETLRAIREGEVDALVVGQTDHPQVFAIGSDAETFRTFLDVMETGAAAVDDRGRVMYNNATFATLLGHDGELQGADLATLLDAEMGLAPLLAANSPAPHSLEVTIHTATGPRYLRVSSKPLSIGTVTGHAVTLTDMTARIAAERAEESERTAQAILSAANEPVLVCDAAGNILHGNLAFRALCGGDPTGEPLETALPLRLSDDRFASLSDLVRTVTSGLPIRGAEASLARGEGNIDFLLSAAPLAIGTGDGCVVTLTDISPRKAAERRQLLMMNELDHRVKNALAMVVAVCRRTLRNARTLDEFGTSFIDRVRALAATHNLLAKNAWKGLTIQSVATAELTPFIGSGTNKVEMSGLERVISAEAAIALGLIFHELATNAVKYGALSTDGGTVRIRLVPRDGAGRTVLEWSESGGPVVERPSQDGFGTTVITQSLQFAPDGEATITFAPEGVRCLMTIPADHLH